jgi:hypothetical protein
MALARHVGTTPPGKIERLSRECPDAVLPAEDRRLGWLRHA